MIDDPDVTILLGDALEQLATLPSESVQCIVTSPPFWGLRDYGTGTWRGGDEACDHRAPARGGDGSKNTLDNHGKPHERTNATFTESKRQPQYGALCDRCGAERVDQQIGLEATPEQWAANLVAVMREARRVLRPDGVAWVEVGDSYANDGKWGGSSGGKNEGQANGGEGFRQRRTTGLKSKDLVGAPWLLAFALRADGWFLRSDVIWARPNPMPESVTDRPTKAHSYVFLLTKSARYFYDADAIREPAANDPKAGGRQRALARGDDRYAQAEFQTHDASSAQRSRNLNASKRRGVRPGVDTNGGGQGNGEMTFPIDSANARSVWSIPTQPTPFAHFATFPEELVRRCIAAGTSERGCCPECGAPWTRIVDYAPGDQAGEAMSRPKRTGGMANPKSSLSMSGNGAEEWAKRGAKRSTLGWEPTCSCSTLDELDSPGPHEPVPCVVLDPFMGSGTTALVARKMGRRAVGIELNAEYLLIASERLSQQSLFS